MRAAIDELKELTREISDTVKKIKQHIEQQEADGSNMLREMKERNEHRLQRFERVAKNIESGIKQRNVS